MRALLALFALTVLVAAGDAQAGLYPEMRPPFVVWVEEGRPKAAIVAKAPAKGTAPAAELNLWLGRITGAELPVSETAPATGPRVFLGGEAAWRRLGTKPEALDLGEDGYVVRTVGNDLVIAGNTNLATLFGVYAFLEHSLGCRWLWGGDSGIVAPKQATLRVGRVDETSRPDFNMRWIIRHRECARFNGAGTSLGEPDDFATWRFVHTWLPLVEPERYWKDHPDYYAEAGGRRVDPTKRGAQVNLCTTNPGVLDAVAAKIDEIVAADPGVNMVSVDPMDTQEFCQCAACRKLLDPDAPYEARASRLVFDFTNRVAERVAQKHPGLLIKTIAYHTYLAPPPFRMRDNVVIQFCRFMCHNHRIDDPSCAENAYFHRQLVAWTKVCRHLSMYEYYSKESWVGLPWPIVHSIRYDIPYLHKLGVRGLASQWRANHAQGSLPYYIATKLLWNARADVDALLADFYEKAYAEAADPMRRYHERLERAMEASGLHVATQRGYRVMHRFLTPELLSGLAADLDAARQAVRDPEAAERVALVARGHRYTTMVAEYLRTIAASVEKGAQPHWRGVGATDLTELAKTCAPQVDALRKFVTAKENEGASSGLGSYQELLLKPTTVASHWFSEGDRQEAGAPRLTKVQWLRQHPQKLSQEAPPRLALWIYGNDLDWLPDTGPEHVIRAVGRDGREVVLGTVGREDRTGDGINLGFILRGIDPAALDPKSIRVTVENAPGGPYLSTLFALYLMPDDPTTEDEATRLIEQNIEKVRERAVAFVEFNYNGRPSGEASPTVANLEIVGYP